MEDKKLKECYDWWENLTEEEQLKIMIDFCPTEVKEDTNIDKMFGDMPSDSQLWIYNRTIRKCRITGTIPINPDRFDLILKKIGRKKLDDNETYSNIQGKNER